MAERKVTKTITDEGIKFVFATGETEVVDPKSFNEEIQSQLLFHGASQKLGDAYSGEDAEKCHAIFMGVLKTLEDGKWSARAGGGGGPRISQIAEALARATEQPVEACVEKLADMSDDDKKAVRAHPQVQAALAAIKLEKAQADLEQANAEAGAEDATPLTL